MKTLTKKQKQLHAEAMARGAAEMAALRAQSGLDESFAEWKKKYDAAVSMHRACLRFREIDP